MIQTPYYLIDKAGLLRNLRTIERVRTQSGAKVLLALKCFATPFTHRQRRSTAVARVPGLCAGTPSRTRLVVKI